MYDDDDDNGGKWLHGAMVCAVSDLVFFSPFVYSVKVGQVNWADIGNQCVHFNLVQTPTVPQVEKYLLDTYKFILNF